MHVHLSGDPGERLSRRRRSTATNIEPWSGSRTPASRLRAGFTTVRDLGSAPQVGFALARGTARGSVPGAAHHRLRARPSRSSAAMATSTASAPRSSRRSAPTTPAPAPVAMRRAGARDVARRRAGDQVHRHRRRALAAGRGPRGAFHRRGDARDRHHRPFARPSGRRPCPWRARHRGGGARRGRFDRARHLRRRRRDRGDAPLAAPRWCRP